VRGFALRLLDVLGPGLVAVDRVDRQPEDLHVPAVELGLDLRHVAELGGAHRSEGLRVREQNGPRIADPIVEADRPFRRVGLEVRGLVAKSEAHALTPFALVSGTGAVSTTPLAGTLPQPQCGLEVRSRRRRCSCWASRLGATPSSSRSWTRIES